MKIEKQIEEWAKIVESQSEENNILNEASFINFDEGSFIGKFSVKEDNPIIEMGAIGKISYPRTYYVYIHGRE